MGWRIGVRYTYLSLEIYSRGEVANLGFILLVLFSRHRRPEDFERRAVPGKPGVVSSSAYEKYIVPAGPGMEEGNSGRFRSPFQSL